MLFFVCVLLLLALVLYRIARPAYTADFNVAPHCLIVNSRCDRHTPLVQERGCITRQTEPLAAQSCLLCSFAGGDGLSFDSTGFTVRFTNPRNAGNLFRSHGLGEQWKLMNRMRDRSCNAWVANILCVRADGSLKVDWHYDQTWTLRARSGQQVTPTSIDICYLRPAKHGGEFVCWHRGVGYAHAVKRFLGLGQLLPEPAAVVHPSPGMCVRVRGVAGGGATGLIDEEDPL